MKVLQVAIEAGRYDLAAHALVKVSKNGKQPNAEKKPGAEAVVLSLNGKLIM